MANLVGTSTFLNPVLAADTKGSLAKLLDLFTAFKMSSEEPKNFAYLAPNLAPAVDTAPPPVAKSQINSEPIAPTVKPKPPAKSFAQKLEPPEINLSPKLIFFSASV